ncbi:hypothetical protein DPEC_G00376500 [Dallia pectoralis]|nr:hypothetical protein DPEC_G00376500 [Dallia pectoralis]
MDTSAAGQKEKHKFASPVPNEKKSGHEEKERNRKEEVCKKKGNPFVGERRAWGSSGGETGGELTRVKTCVSVKKGDEQRKKEQTHKKSETVSEVRGDSGSSVKGCLEQKDNEGEKGGDKRGETGGDDGGDDGANVKKRKQKCHVHLTNEESDSGKERLTMKMKKENGENEKVLSLTDSQYDDIFQSAIALETPGHSCLEDARAFLSEVELLQNSIDQISHREKEKKKEEEKQDGDEVGNIEYPSNSKGVSGERKRGRPGCQTRRSREEEEETDDSSDSSMGEYDQWVQCSLSVCEKWRRVQGHVDLAVLPKDWTCSHSTGPGLCEAVQESWSGNDGDINSNLVPGSLVWAQQSGYPWWPAMIERDPDTRTFCQLNLKTDPNPVTHTHIYIN